MIDLHHFTNTTVNFLEVGKRLEKTHESGMNSIAMELQKLVLDSWCHTPDDRALGFISKFEMC